MGAGLAGREMNANAKSWVAALRSGEFKQAVGALRKGDAYCCLGVACELYRRETGDGMWKRDQYKDYRFDTRDADLPESVRAWFGLADHLGGVFYGESLAERNDAGESFTAIAYLIESEPEGLFETNEQEKP